MPSKKAQAVVIDLFFALIIFIITLSFVVGTYGHNVLRLEYDTNYGLLMLKAFDITEMLTKSEGIPIDWNVSSVQAIGLASNDRVLSTEKITRLSNISYNKSRELFGIVGKEFFLQIRDLYNVNLFEAGISPLEGNTCGDNYEAVTLRRFAVWEGQTVILHFTLWDDLCAHNGSAGRLFVGSIQKYSGVPAIAFEEDNSPSWTTQVQTKDDFQYATAVDESLYKPDYIQFDFPNLGITSNKAVMNATFKVWHREYLAGGTLPASEVSRHEIQCWNGNWISLGAYNSNVQNVSFAEHSAAISSCITSVSLANNINIRMTYDPAFDAGGTQDIDYAEVIVNAA